MTCASTAGRENRPPCQRTPSHVGGTALVVFAAVALRSQRQPAGDVSITRDELVGNGWKSRIPDDVVARLRVAGAPALPSHACAS